MMIYMTLEWTPTTDYHYKPKELEPILFVTATCPYTGETNRVHAGYMMYDSAMELIDPYSADYELAHWFSYLFDGYDPVETDDVVAWMPMPTYKVET